MDAAIRINTLSKTFGNGRKALQQIDLTIAPGEMVALIGASGSGKSSLLRHMAGLMAGDASDEGSIVIHGRTVQRHGKIASNIRSVRSGIGFVFQFHHLLPAFSALENVTMPAVMREGRVSARQLAHARELLAAVGLANALDKRPAELSGGMQQRVAIARALVQEPALVLADEPTGNLDTASSDEVFVQLRRMHAERGVTFIIVTHDPRLGARCDRMVELADGQISCDEPIITSALS